MRNFTNEVIDRLGGPAKAATLFKISTQAVCDWLKKGRIPPDKWETVISELPDVTLDRCYDQFVRKQRKHKKTKH